MFLEKISSKEIIDLNVPTGIPLVYNLDDRLHPVQRYYLGSEKHIKSKINQVAEPDKIME